MQQLRGLFALEGPGGGAQLCCFLPSIHARRLGGHLRPAPASRVAAHWGRTGLVGAVGQGGGEKAEAATCGHRQDCGEGAPGGLFQISSPTTFLPFTPPSSIPLPATSTHLLLQLLHNPQPSPQSLHPCGSHPQRAGRRWARLSSASAAPPPCLGGEANEILKPQLTPCLKSPVPCLVMAFPLKALRLAPRVTSYWDLPYS